MGVPTLVSPLQQQQHLLLTVWGLEASTTFPSFMFPCEGFHKFWALDCIGFPCVSVPEDLSLEERDELLNIRRRKRELLDDIEVRLRTCRTVSCRTALFPWFPCNFTDSECRKHNLLFELSSVNFSSICMLEVMHLVLPLLTKDFQLLIEDFQSFFNAEA